MTTIQTQKKKNTNKQTHVLAHGPSKWPSAPLKHTTFPCDGGEKETAMEMVVGTAEMQRESQKE